MYQEVNFNDFKNWFLTNETYKNNFSYDGLKALYDYLEDNFTDYKFDPIAICCDYTEYNNAYEAMEQHQPDAMPIEGIEGDDLVEISTKNEAEALRWLKERTTVLVFDRGVIINNF